MLSRVLHDWADVDAQALLRNVARVAPEGTTLYVVEREVDEDTPGHHGVLSLHLFCTHGAVERTAAQWRALLEGSDAGGWVLESKVRHGDHVIMCLQRSSVSP